MKVSTQVQLKPNERLAGVSKDYHVRKQGGKYLCYIVQDKNRSHVMLAQKLSTIADAINQIVPERTDRVSVTGLYDIINNDNSKVGGWTKHRWKVQPYTFEEAPRAFESMRQGYENALLLGSHTCYRTECA